MKFQAIIRRKLSGVLILLLVMGIVGCGSSDNSSDSGQKAESHGSGEDQLAKPNSGDTIAIFHIKEYGDVTVRMFPKGAPKAVENFTTHAKEGYYDGVIFHRVINEFMIQGGDPNGTGNGGESIWGKEFEDEIVPNLLPIRGALCMANRGANTNGSQFFIVQCKEANMAYAPASLTAEQKKMFQENGGYPSLVGGYTVFGQVVDGMDVVDKIAATETGANNRPTSDVVIETIEITEQE